MGGWGLKCLKTFNLTLIAKQGWCILNNECSLLYIIYKVRYITQDDFFGAKKGPDLSFTWRRIWEAKKFPLKGCRWKIEDGRSVHIWKDTWILGVITPIMQLDTFAEEAHHIIVSSLITSDDKR